MNEDNGQKQEDGRRNSPAVNMPRITHSGRVGDRSATTKVGHMGVGRPREQVWSFLVRYMKSTAGRPPTAREIKRGAGLGSMATVQQSLTELERDGLIRRGEFGQSRGVRIVGAVYLLPGETQETA